MKKINNYNLKKIKSGQKFKNLRELCNFLQIDYDKYKQKNTRNGLLRALGLIANFKKEGHNIVIEEVFDLNLLIFLKKLKEYNYYDDYYYQIVIELLLLLQDNSNELCISTTQLLLKLHIYNSKFKKDFFKKRERIIKKFKIEDISNIQSKVTINKFMFSLYSKNASKLEGILNNMAEDKIITKEKNKYMLINDSELTSIKLNKKQFEFYQSYKDKYLHKLNRNHYYLFHPSNEKKFMKSFSKAYKNEFGTKVIKIYNKYEIKLIKNIDYDIQNIIKKESSVEKINILSKNSIDEMCKKINSIPKKEAKKLINYYITCQGTIKFRTPTGL